MDLQDWEILPDDGFLEIEYDGGKKIFSRKYVSDAKAMFKNDYFTSPSSPQFVESTEQPRLPKQLLPLPVQLELTIDKPIDQESTNQLGRPLSGDPDPVYQVFFKKMESEKFADMKVDSPRSRMIHQQFEMKGNNPSQDESMESETDSGIARIKEEKDNGEDSESFNLWKWSLTGIGAICSLGVAAAAATVCIIFFGTRQKNHHHHRLPQSQKLQFHIYTDDKRIKRVVRHATRLNEALSAAAGVPITRAHFTIGGYCEGL